MWVWDLRTISAEIEAEAPNPREGGQEALLGGSDREVTTTYSIPVAFRKETNHSVRSSRAMDPNLEVIPCAQGVEGAMEPGTGYMYMWWAQARRRKPTKLKHHACSNTNSESRVCVGISGSTFQLGALKLANSHLRGSPKPSPICESYVSKCWSAVVLLICDSCSSRNSWSWLAYEIVSVVHVAPVPQPAISCG